MLSNQTNSKSKREERIDFLADLHRPLEEHWKEKAGVYLDPKGSDYMYKHHISHLHSIYTKEMVPEEIGEGCILPNMIPGIAITVITSTIVIVIITIIFIYSITAIRYERISN